MRKRGAALGTLESWVAAATIYLTMMNGISPLEIYVKEPWCGNYYTYIGIQPVVLTQLSRDRMVVPVCGDPSLVVDKRRPPGNKSPIATAMGREVHGRCCRSSMRSFGCPTVQLSLSEMEGWIQGMAAGERWYILTMVRRELDFTQASVAGRPSPPMLL